MFFFQTHFDFQKFSLHCGDGGDTTCDAVITALEGISQSKDVALEFVHRLSTAMNHIFATKEKVL